MDDPANTPYQPISKYRWIKFARYSFGTGLWKNWENTGVIIMLRTGCATCQVSCIVCAECLKKTHNPNRLGQKNSPLENSRLVLFLPNYLITNCPFFSAPGHSGLRDLQTRSAPVYVILLTFILI